MTSNTAGPQNLNGRGHAAPRQVNDTSYAAPSLLAPTTYWIAVGENRSSWKRCRWPQRMAFRLPVAFRRYVNASVVFVGRCQASDGVRARIRSCSASGSPTRSECGLALHLSRLSA